MKIIHVLPILLLSAAFTDVSAQRFAIGPRVGVNFASFSTDALNDTEESKAAAESYEEDRRALAGPQVGIITNLAFSENLSFQPEFLFSAKGFKQEGTLDVDPIPVKYESKTIMNYLEVPLLLKGSFGNESRKVSLLAGPYVGYLLGGRERREVNGQEVYKEKLNFEFSDEVDQKFQHFDAGAVIGASGSYRAGVGTLMIDVRYNYGLANVFEYRDEAIDGGVKIFNRTFSVSFGYMYHWGTKGAFKPKPRLDENPEPTNQNNQ